MRTSSSDEPELVRKAQAGDTQAFGELVLAYQSFAYNLALRALGDPHEAQDLTQEAFLRAWRGLAGFRGASGFRTWLYRIVMNLCYNRSPQLKRQLAELPIDQEEHPPGAPGEASLPPDTAGQPWQAGSPDPQSELEADELRKLLHRQIESLPSTYRMLVLLRYQQDLSYEEIAQVLEMPLGSVKTGLHRAHQRLKAALSETEFVRRQPAGRLEAGSG